MDKQLTSFNEYLKNSRSLSKNSLLAYGRDAREFLSFLEGKSVTAPADTTNADIIAFLYQLRNEGKTEATVNRKLASIRAFFAYLQKAKGLRDNPALEVKAPKIRKKTIDHLSTEEIDKLLNYPGKTMKGIRDKALLEILYASGMRVSELVGINLDALNIHIGFVMIEEELGKARVIPLGRPARAALEKYIYELRELLIKSKSGENREEEALFLSMAGKRLTRQGVWKIIRENADAAGIKTKITPQILRNTFAVHLVQNGADIKTLQELMGHEDVAATQVYMEFSKNRIKDVYDSAHPRA